MDRISDIRSTTAAPAREYYPLPRSLVAAMRRADLFTGAFAAALPAEVADPLCRLGLVTQDLSGLTGRGMEVRNWLMLGSPSAPAVVSALLEPSSYRMAA